ncbi:MAG: ISL3 family transposase [Rhodothermales bacterium]|nr:ISL3 family transposase [Rhodothermales bacterium]
MKDKTLSKHYGQLIGLVDPWEVAAVDLSHSEQEVRIELRHRPGAPLKCPECGERCPGYDTRERRWRHLDTMQYQTTLIARVPRMRCPEHGIRQVEVPWAEPGSRFTALFEALVIDWLREASFAAVARQIGLSWDQVAGIQERAVRRGLARREHRYPRRIGVDETSFQRRHEYVTTIHDLDTGEVVYVADERRREVLDTFYEGPGEGACSRLEVVTMDMWAPYIASTRAYVPDADSKIVFDKFHVAKHLGDAVDKVRRQEHRELRAQGDYRLARTKYHWLQNPQAMNRRRRQEFNKLRRGRLRVARAWVLKEEAMALWGYQRRGWAERGWQRWYDWAIRSRLEPVKRVARMIKTHWSGVINAATTHITNARAEGLNSRIQWIKRMACGYRNRERFRNAIYFHLGGLDLYPENYQSAHSIS